MGDRSVIQIDHDKYGGDKSISLYSHSYGINLLSELREALGTAPARNRWDDQAYLTRIIFQYILDKDGWDEYGFGIYPGDDYGQEYPLIRVSVANQKVYFGESSWSFQDFVDSDDIDEYVKAYWDLSLEGDSSYEAWKKSNAVEDMEAIAVKKLFDLQRDGNLIYRTAFPGYWVKRLPYEQDSDRLPDLLQDYMNKLEPLTEEQQAYLDKINRSNEAKK